MARFNQTKMRMTLPDTINLAGGKGYSLTPELEMASILLTSFGNDQFYRSANDTIDRLGYLTMKNPEFAAKAAVYARNEFGMRTITHVLAAIIVKHIKGEKWTRPFIRDVIRRPDDMTEILSLYLESYGKPIPNSLKKGFSDAISKFSAYQLAKYRMSNNKLKMVDIFNLVHPIPISAERQELYSSLVKGELRSFDTWESQLTEAGNNEDAKEKVWSDLVPTKKLGYLALLRNLRNISKQAPDILDSALERLVDKDEIKHSLIFPFQYLVAMGSIEGLEDNSHYSKTISALNKATELSLSNIPIMPGKTLVAIDTSGSMQVMPWDNTKSYYRSLKRDSFKSPAAIGSLFGAAFFKAHEPGIVDLMTFDSNANYVNANHDDSLSTLTKHLKGNGGATFFNKIFSKANKIYDRIIILSDMQALVNGNAMDGYKAYKKRFKVSPKIYSIDLAGYGTSQFPIKNVYSIAGFSDKIFDIMKLMEEDKDALIHRIESIKFI